MHASIDEHWKEVKRVLQYLKEMESLGLCILCNFDYNYANADWVGNLNDRISILGYILFFRVNSVNWSSKELQAMTCSSTELIRV